MKLNVENIIILQTVMKSLSQGVDPSIKKVNSRGEEYITNMYDRDAQKFVLTHVIPQLCKLS